MFHVAIILEKSTW